MKSGLLCLLLLLTSVSSKAGYLSISESGETLPANIYRVGFEPQLLINEGGGANVDAFVDLPGREDLSFRAMAGAGKIDFHVGASAKYVPFPDVDNQPAIGGRVAAWYARANSQDVLTLQLAPLVSKHFDTDNGRFIPYVAIPVNITNTKARGYTGTQFVAGTEWKNPDWPDLFMTGELAINLNDSYSALTFALAYSFDGTKGFKR